MPSAHPDTSAQDAQPSTPLSTQSRFIGSNPFRRAPGSAAARGMLARLASVSSSSSSPLPRAQNQSSKGAQSGSTRPAIGSRIASRASRRSLDLTGANLQELSKSNGKFKSLAKWDSQQQAPEPFMEASDSTAAERERTSALKLHSALASGSTAAAQAHAQSRGLGQPTLPPTSSISCPLPSSTSPSSTSPISAASQLPTVSQTIEALGNSGVHPDILGTAQSSTMQTQPAPALVAAPVTPVSHSSKSTPIELHLKTISRDSRDSATPCTTPPLKSRQHSHSEQATLDNHMVARAAQLVLEAARQQARVETRKKGRSAPASPKRSLGNLSSDAITTTNSSTNGMAAAQEPAQDLDEAHSELQRTSCQRTRSKSDAGTETQVKRRKSFLQSMASKSRRASSQPLDPESDSPTADANSPTTASGTTSGTVTPGGRRRRYVDTRDLDLLARELAAEAIAEQLPQPPYARPSRSGSSSPHRVKALNDPRRRSFPSILEDSPLQDDSISSIRSAPNGLKPMTPLHASPPSNAPNARAKAADVKSHGLVSASPWDPTKGLVPKEMFLGLGGSPYPSLAPPSLRSDTSTLHTLDPFGIPVTHESSPYDATTAYANKTTVYHTPSQVAVSRNLSNNPNLAASQTNAKTRRRPVLTMTMNDPVAELQGLTKPPKEFGTKRLTPFGSRAGSRAPSPSPSLTDLKREAAKDEQNVSAADTRVPSADADEKVASRRNSMAPSEMSIRSSLAPVTSSKQNRLSMLFGNKSKVQVDTLSSVTTPSNVASDEASTSASPERSIYATPTGETPSLVTSPQSVAISAGSDADVSPVAFRQLDLAATHDTSRSSQPSSVTPSRRSSLVFDSAEPSVAGAKKRPVRALLRRLSSFSSKKKESKVEKLHVPDASTMPVVDMDKLKQLSEAKDERANDADGAGTVSEVIEHLNVSKSDSKASSVDAVTTSDVVKDEVAEAHGDANVKTGLVAAVRELDLSNASPVPVNEEMAKNGFGTRSAYKFTGSRVTLDKVERVELDDEIDSEAQQKEQVERGVQEEQAMLAAEDAWDSKRAGQIARSDSQTPSSEDSFFLGSGPSNTSRPGSGALMKHGSESAISEELHTPDPSTAYLPATKMEEAMMEGASTLSSAVSDATATATAAAAAAAAAAASVKMVASADGAVTSPVVTALPNGHLSTGSAI